MLLTPSQISAYKLVLSTRSKLPLGGKALIHRLALGAILEFFMPRHLNGFELALIGGFRIAFKIGEFGHVAVQIGKPDGKRVKFGMSFGEKDANVFGIVPGDGFRHGESPNSKLLVSGF